MTDIKSVQKRLLDMAECVRSILEGHSIPYVITYGTLLGAVRHKGFIPWDDDFDIYLFDDTYDQAIAALVAELPANLFLENEDTEPLYFHGWAHVKDLYSTVICSQFPQDGFYQHHGLCIDLYKATRIPRESLKLFQAQEIINYLQRKLRHGLISEQDYALRAEDAVQEVAREQEKAIQNPADVIYGFMSLDGDYLEVSEVFPTRAYDFEGHSFQGPREYDSFLRRCYGDYMSLPPVEKRVPHYSEIHFSKPNEQQ